MPDFMPTPHFASPPIFSPFPGLRAATLPPGVCLTPGGVLRGRRWLCQGIWAPYLSAAARARAQPPALPPRRLSHRAPPPASPLLPLGRVGQRWQPRWGQPEPAKPRGPEPLPGLYLRCSAPELCPAGAVSLAGSEPPGKRPCRICPCRMTKWYGRGLSPLWWEGWHLASTCLIPPFPRKSTFPHSFIAPPHPFLTPFQ